MKKRTFINGSIVGIVEHYYMTGEIKLRTRYNEKGIRDEDIIFYTKRGDIIKRIPLSIFDKISSCSIM